MLTYVVALRLLIEGPHGQSTTGKATILPCRDYRHALAISHAMTGLAFEATVCVELCSVNYQRAYIPVNSLRHGQLDSIPRRDDMFRGDDE